MHHIRPVQNKLENTFISFINSLSRQFNVVFHRSLSVDNHIELDVQSNSSSNCRDNVTCTFYFILVLFLQGYAETMKDIHIQIVDRSRYLFDTNLFLRVEITIRSNFDNNWPLDVYAKSISLFEQVYHDEDFVRNKCWESTMMNIFKTMTDNDKTIDLLVEQRE
jgi:hypothetical protein